MTEIELLEKGYFAKELPPPFQTEDFAHNLAAIRSAWARVSSSTHATSATFKEKFRESKWVNYSIPKVGFARRILGVPNPFHQIALTKSISDNWIQIESIFNKSLISASKPIKDISGKRALKSIKTFGEFKKECFICSYDRLFELKTDISRFYGTVYTHVIPWIIHTKPIAKINRRNLSYLGNILDKNLRESNSGQTLGIPIGPDTSLVIAEIIGCTFDQLIQKKFGKSVKGFRFIDDYYLYCKSQSDAEKVFKYIQSIFTEYQLDINEEKTIITKAPFPSESDWSIELGTFTFRNNPNSQQTDIERFTSLAFKNAKLYPRDSVLSFAISILKSLSLYSNSWPLYQSTILKFALAEPVTLPTVAQILISYKPKSEKQKIKTVCENIIKEHAPKGHHFEVAWALWLCKEFKIHLPNSIAKLVFNSNDVISILIGLDLRNDGYINRTFPVGNLELELTNESLMEDKWLLTYEAVTKGWLLLPSPMSNPVNNNEFFNILHNSNVKFYDESRRLTPLKIKPPKTNSIESRLKVNVEYETDEETLPLILPEY